MTTGPARRLCVAIFLFLVLVACAVPSVEPDAGQAAPENRYGAPPVPDPRDVTSRATDPCTTLLSPAQLDALDYASPGEPDETVLGAPVCIYRDDNSRRSAHVTVETVRNRLVDAYQTRVMPIFTPTTIDGLPATHEQSYAQAITCTTIVGIADDQAIAVDTTVESQPTGPPLIDPCEDGARVAEAVVSTLPPA